ncbi:probable inactive shikimate kinase like 1, chloroplastic [Vitis riparia]|uniref:probable inactive shikimate kinase like 1, chloroplastic n=1 Tax=Vitis riparia TaxID=96939 RepID=UPI00155A08AC|nr:probable inactive shikimate kinase like 1, chloroplastic [Vitis riparia]
MVGEVDVWLVIKSWTTTDTSVVEARKRLKGNGLKKEPGHSLIGANGKDAEFHAIQSLNEAAPVLAASIVAKQLVTKLNLIENELRDEGAIHISKALEDGHATLKELDLSSNFVRKAGTGRPPVPDFKKKAMEISSVLKGASIFLVGTNNTIKTNMGKLPAYALGYYHFGNDSLVEEARGGESAAKSLKEQDEEEFRDSETEVLKQLSSMVQLVVCAGNGSVHSSINLALLRHWISIWIDVPIGMVAKNVIEEGVQIPESELSIAESYSETGGNQVLAQLVMMYEERKGGYATTDASISLQKVASQLSYDDLDAVTPEDMTMEVLKEIQRLARLKKMKRDLCFLQALRPPRHPFLACAFVTGGLGTHSFSLRLSSIAYSDTHMCMVDSSIH